MRLRVPTSIRVAIAVGVLVPATALILARDRRPPPRGASPGASAPRLAAASSGHGSGPPRSAPAPVADESPERSPEVPADGLPIQPPERRALDEIESLVRRGRIGVSHAKAERFYARFPDSPAIAHIERLTGYHRRPRGPEG